jgi:hypothetical protein
VEAWAKNVEKYCKEFDIPVDHLADILRDSKVNPMIRGKGFEYSARDYLTSMLNKNTWEVSKPRMNAQANIHDVDLLVTHKQYKVDFTVECKLSKKGSFKVDKNGNASASVKCMRSRTLGAAQVKARAPQLMVSIDQLTVHNDNYWDNEFEIVLSSLGNSFYETDLSTGDYVFSPKPHHLPIIQQILSVSTSDFQSDAFSYFFVARSRDLTPAVRGTKCARQKCTNKSNCRFIPNYPEVKFTPGSGLLQAPWLPISQLENLLLSILSE